MIIIKSFVAVVFLFFSVHYLKGFRIGINIIIQDVERSQTTKLCPCKTKTYDLTASVIVNRTNKDCLPFFLTLKWKLDITPEWD